MQKRTNRILSAWSRSREGFGLLQPLAFLLSMACIVVSIIALLTIWRWSLHKDPELGFWTDFAMKNRIVLAITVFTAVLRLSVMFQLGVCCAMVATIVFENDSLLLRDTAAMSIYRFSPPPLPYSFALPVLHGHKRSRWLILPVLILMALVFATNLFAPILVADTKLGSIDGPIKKQAIPYWEVRLMVDKSFGWTKPLQFPTFSERRGKEYKVLDTTTGQKLSDTGETMRGYFPLTKDSRATLLSYDGLVQMQKLRTVCVTPELDDFKLIAPPEFINRHDTVDLVDKLSDAKAWRNVNNLMGNDAFIEGNISASFLFDRKNSAFFENFNLGREAPSKNTSLLQLRCRLPIYTIFWNQEFICVLDWHSSQPFPDYAICNYNPENNCQIEWYMVFSQFPAGSAAMNFPRRSFPGNWIHSMFQKDGFQTTGTEWIQKTLPFNGNNFTLGLTLCAINNVAARAHISTTIRKNFSEPEPKPIAAPDDPSKFYYNTSSVVDQLDQNAPSSKRGVFPLTSYTMNGSFRQSWLFKEPTGEPISISLAHDIYMSLYNSTMNLRGPTSALQSIFSLYFTNLMYELMDGYNDRSDTADCRFREPVIIPTKKTGLCIVLGITAIHLLLVTAIFSLFFSVTDGNTRFLDQAWHVIGQLYNSPARDIVERAGSMSDSQVGGLDGVVEQWKSPVRKRRNDTVGLMTRERSPSGNDLG